MPLKLIVTLLILSSFFIFYYRKLHLIFTKSKTITLSLFLSILSLTPIGWIIGAGIIYFLRKFKNQLPKKHAKICAKCGYLSKSNHKYCKKCNSPLN